VAKQMTRREMLLAGTGAAGAAAALLAGGTPVLADRSRRPMAPASSLPVKRIKEIMETQDASVSDDVLMLEIDRDDLKHVTGPGGIPFLPSFQLDGMFFYQALDNGKAILNGDFPLLPEEINPFIDKLLAGGLVFQAFHQHFFDLNPMVFFIHFRGIGDPLKLAHAIINAVKVTGTPLPQNDSGPFSTPLDASRLANILGGTAEVKEGGVVSVSIERANRERLGGVLISPALGVEVTVDFEPLHGGKAAAVVPDYALVASEVVPVIRTMRQEGFAVHCLYNQETDEFPQLYFSHCLKVGDPYALAHQVRKALNKMNLDFV
jgi:hypothetical protein